MLPAGASCSRSRPSRSRSRRSTTRRARTPAVRRRCRGERRTGLRRARALRSRLARPPAVAVVERNRLDRFRWEEVVDEVLYQAPPRRRSGASRSCDNGLGPQETRGSHRPADARRRHVQVSVQGRALDLTFKEFELLRFLAGRPGVCSRGPLMREVWGRDFYGGTGPSTCTCDASGGSDLRTRA